MNNISFWWIIIPLAAIAVVWILRYMYLKSEKDNRYDDYVSSKGGKAERDMDDMNP